MNWTLALLLTSRSKTWSASDAGGISLVLFLVIFLIVTVHLWRKDKRANLRRKWENNQAWAGALRDFDKANKNDPIDPDKIKKVEPEIVEASTAALPDEVSVAQFKALTPDMKASLLKGVRKRG